MVVIQSRQKIHRFFVVFFPVVVYCFHNIDQEPRTDFPESAGPRSFGERSLPVIL